MNIKMFNYSLQFVLIIKGSHVNLTLTLFADTNTKSIILSQQQLVFAQQTYNFFSYNCALSVSLPSKRSVAKQLCSCIQLNWMKVNVCILFVNCVVYCVCILCILQLQDQCMKYECKMSLYSYCVNKQHADILCIHYRNTLYIQCIHCVILPTYYRLNVNHIDLFIFV